MCLPEKRRTKLEKFIMLFNQDFRTDYDYILDIPQVPEGFIDMAKYLQMPLLDDQFRRNMLAEEEVREEQAILRMQIAETEKKLREAEIEKTEAEIEKIEAKKKEQEERRQKVLLATQFAIHLKQTGAAIEEIIKVTGLNAEELTALGF